MRKTVIFLVCLTLISLSVSKTSNMDRILSQMVQLNQQVGKDSAAIGVLVSQVSVSLKENHEQTGSVYEQMRLRCQTGEKVIEDFIAGLKSKVLESEVSQTNAKLDMENAQTEARRIQEQMVAEQDKLEDLKKQIVKEFENLKVYGAEAEQKIVVIKTLRDILEDEFMSKENSFVQLQTQVLSQKVEDARGVLKGLNSKQSKLPPIILTLLQVAENRAFSDSKIIAKIVEVLDKLNDNLRTFRQLQETEGRKHITDLENSSRSVAQQIKSFTNLILDSKRIADVNQDIMTQSKIYLEETAATIHRKEFEVQYWNKICEYQNQLREKSLSVTRQFSDQVEEVTRNLSNLE